MPDKDPLQLDINIESPETGTPSWFSDLAHLEDNWIHQTSPWTGARWEDGGGAVQVIGSGSDVIQQFANLKVPKKKREEEAGPDVLNPNTALILQAVRIAGTPVDHSAKPIGPAESLGGPEKVGQGLVLIPQSAWLARKSAPDFVLEKIDDELWDQSLNAGDSEIYTYTFPAKASGQLVLINYAYSNVIQDGDFLGQINPVEFDPSYVDPSVTPPGPAPNYIDVGDEIDAIPIFSFTHGVDPFVDHYYSWSPLSHFWWMLVNPGKTLIVTQKWGSFPSAGDGFPNYQYKINLHAWVLSHEGGGTLTVRERPRNGISIDTFTSRTDPSPTGGDPQITDEVISSMGGSGTILDWIAFRSCFASFTSIPEAEEVIDATPDSTRPSLKARLSGASLMNDKIYEDIGLDILTNEDFTSSRNPGGKNFPGPGPMGFINAVQIMKNGAGKTYPVKADYVIPIYFDTATYPTADFGHPGGFPGMAIGATVTTFEIGVT